VSRSLEKLSAGGSHGRTLVRECTDLAGIGVAMGSHRMSFPSNLIRVAILAVGVAWTVPGRAAMEQTCESLASLADCAEADVGKVCSGGGACSQIYCRGGDAAMVFKCSCSPGIGVPDGGCPSDAGAPPGTSPGAKASSGCDLTGQSSRGIDLGALGLVGAAAIAVLADDRRRQARLRAGGQRARRG
jgi:hypothetical protein